jgi:Methyltransferase domain
MHVAYTAAHYEPGKEWKSQMELARLSEDGIRAERHYHLPYGINGAGREKNWQFFADEGRLRFVYSVGPHVVMDVETGEKWGDLDGPKWGFGKIGGGTPPVKIGKEWLSFFHSWEDHPEHVRVYHLGAYTFREGDYRITSMTPSPLLTARESDGFVFEVAKCRWHPLCVFPAGAHWDAAKDEWLISLGVNDSWCELLTLNGPELSRFLAAPKWLAPVAKLWQHRTEIINDIIAALGGTTYLEIGYGDGKNFTAIQCAHKLSVDPAEGVYSTARPTHQMTSDEFFASNEALFDVIFIDGLHHADQVRRDLDHALAALKPGGVVLCHDLNPTTETMQQVPRATSEWTGDGWKAWCSSAASAQILPAWW